MCQNQRSSFRDHRKIRKTTGGTPLLAAENSAKLDLRFWWVGESVSGTKEKWALLYVDDDHPR